MPTAKIPLMVTFRVHVIFFLLCSQVVYGFLGPFQTLQSIACASPNWQSQHRIRLAASAVQVANETEILADETLTTKRIYQVKASSISSEESDDYDDDDDQFEAKVQDSKFMERNKYWVVLVDDEEAIRLAVGDYLYDQGYQVTACADADAFLDVCQRGLSSENPRAVSNNKLPPVPDAIISDIRMPGKDGLELLGLIRQDERLNRVPVILLTAKGMTADRIAGYKAGANVYLPKPFAPEELLSILDNTIQRRKQMTNNQKGSLVDLKQEMANIKEMMKRNSEKVVERTDVYLTLVEREVLELICRGYTNKEIATERGVNVMGINRIIQKLYGESQTETRTQLVRWAIKTGYVSKR